jgi:UDP-N-acetylglucosamine transferase subunit ALG13
MPFDRLVRGVDEWAGSRGAGDVFAQIGPTELRPRHIQWAKFIDAKEFKSRMDRARVVVAHAGMGSIITALELGKPILVMPRRGALRETRNDHQVATAKRFLELGRVAVAFDEAELPARLDELDRLRAGDRIGGAASASLLTAIRTFIEQS